MVRAVAKKLQRRFRGGAEVAMCRGGAEVALCRGGVVQRCRGAEVQRYRFTD